MTKNKLGIGIGVAGVILVALAAWIVAGAQAGGATETITASDAKIASGGSGKVTVDASNFAEPGLGAWVIDIQYDPAILNIDSCESEHANTFCNTEFAENALRIAGADAAGRVGDFEIASITFSCKQTGIGSGAVVQIDELFDPTKGTPNAIEADAVDGTVTCNAGTPAVTATPTTQPTATAQPTGTPTSGLLGDANCDGVVNSIDAAFVLQYTAALITLGQIPCPDLADANEDGEVDAIDAALILQDDAGFIDLND